MSVMELWLPILLSAVGVFVVSSIVHMALGYHKSDCKGFPDEEALLEAREHCLRPSFISLCYLHEKFIECLS